MTQLDTNAALGGAIGVIAALALNAYLDELLGLEARARAAARSTRAAVGA